MARSTGLGKASPLQRRGGGRIVEAFAGTSALKVAVDDLVANPLNPPARVDEGKIEGLAASMRQIGVIQPVLAVTAETWLQQRPEHAEEVGERGWVVIDGNRRLAAARLAGLEHVPVYHRTDLHMQDLSAETILHSNLHWLRLTPLEEAEQYQRLAAEGVSQRQIAAAVGVSQSQIAKRLQLLRLVPTVQEYLAAERITVKDALDLAPATERVQARAVHGIVELGWLPATAISRAEQALRMEDAAALAETEGTVVYQGQVSYDPDDIDAARLDGSLVVVPAHAGQDEPRLARMTTSAAPERSAEQDAERREQAERRKAAAAREAHLVEVTRSRPSAKHLTDTLTRVTLRGCGTDAASAALALKVLQARGVETYSDGWDLRRGVTTATGRARIDMAWLLALAADETAARTPHSPWGPLDAEYLALLIEHGYTPTAWEHARLDTLKQQEEK